MFTHEIKSVVFNGVLRARMDAATVPVPAEGEPPVDGLELCRPEKPMRYSILVQSSDDLRDQENSPGVSMWPYLLASAQTQRLNEISIYSEKGTTPEKMRFLYLNDFALHVWAEMKKDTKVLGRLHRPPRGAVLAFGMPFAD